MHQSNQQKARPQHRTALAIAAALLCATALSQPNLAYAGSHGGAGGFHGGGGFSGFHGGGFRGSHGGGFRGDAFHGNRFVFTLPESELTAVQSALKAGPVRIFAMSRDDNRQLAEGTLAVLDNQISQTTGTMRLKRTFPNQDQALWPGEFLNIRLLARTEQNVVTMPSGALQRGPDGYYAYIVKSDSTVEARPLKVGQVSNGVAIVENGVAAGDRVVTAGQYRLQPGARVAINSPAAKG